VRSALVRAGVRAGEVTARVQGDDVGPGVLLLPLGLVLVAMIAPALEVGELTADVLEPAPPVGEKQAAGLRV
jgi:hypothetical protein